MGLLDFMGTGAADDPRTMATMQLAAGLLRNGKNLGQGFADGGMGYGSTMAAAAERQRQREMEGRRLALEEAVKQAQIREYQAQAQQRQEQARALQLGAQRARQFQGALGQAGTTSAQQALLAGGGPTPGNAAMVGAPRMPDWNALAMQHPEQIDLIKKLAEARNFGRPEVARTVDGMDPQGRPATMQLDRFGQPVGQALQQWKAPQMIDSGGQLDALDPVTMQVLAQFRKTNTPDALLGAQTTMRGQNMVDARSREDNAVSLQNGKIPAGYRMKLDGTLEAIPGGPADIKAGELGAKTAARSEAAKVQAADVLETVKEAKGLVGNTTAGFGGLIANIPATTARDLQAKLTTIKANLGFDRLQQMREASPTGGALGQVAVQELVALQSTVASLDQLQSPADLRQALNKIERHYTRWSETLGGSSGGASGGWGDGQKRGRSIDDLLKQYGGN